ncbi:hypothetical protein KOR42_54520 [Thalassoglobus neptunius]|uniref:PEP-CTERM protein-sorting domain-containing protein n=2 Tax=Thalassoglobus neptunius TaxID=1938619 RepID=A0A5C5UVX2_9PLAN|nr:hypothetical protein KOR42_54520 [Thalassoglobus neptunius]
MVIAENALSIVSFGAAVFDTVDRAQSFTATQSGKLTTIELQLWRNPTGNPSDDLSVSLTTLNGAGLPDLTGVLASRTVGALDIPTDGFSTNFTSVDFSSSMIDLIAGEMYAIVLTSNTGSTPDWYLWSTSELNPYADGVSFFGIGVLSPIPGQDSGFRVNAASVVPEPASAFLMLTGVCGVGLLRRRSRTR